MRTSTTSSNRVINRRIMILSSLSLLFIWAILAHLVQSPIKIPSPQATFLALIEIIQEDGFSIAILASLRRVVLSFILSAMIGIGLGMLAGFIDPIYYLLQPIVIIQRAMPTMGVILLALIWLSREVAPMLVGFLIIFPIIYTTVVHGVRDIDPKLLEMAKIYQFSERKKLAHLYLPSIQNALSGVLASAISLNMKVNIAAEVLSQPRYSIGTGFQMEKVSLDTAGVIAWSMIAIVIAGLLEWLITILFQVKKTR